MQNLALIYNICVHIINARSVQGRALVIKKILHFIVFQTIVPSSAYPHAP